MTYEQLVHHLADEARRRVRNGQSKNYALAIHFVCNGVSSLKKEVGSVLGKRGVVKKKIAKIKKTEEAQKKQKVKQLKFDF